MKKLVIIGLSALLLAACGDEELTKLEETAVEDVIADVTSDKAQLSSVPQDEQQQLAWVDDVVTTIGTWSSYDATQTSQLYISNPNEPDYQYTSTRKFNYDPHQKYTSFSSDTSNTIASETYFVDGDVYYNDGEKWYVQENSQEKDYSELNQIAYESVNNLKYAVENHRAYTIKEDEEGVVTVEFSFDDEAITEDQQYSGTYSAIDGFEQVYVEAVDMKIFNNNLFEYNVLFKYENEAGETAKERRHETFKNINALGEIIVPQEVKERAKSYLED